jgi:hypothetical protein
MFENLIKEIPLFLLMGEKSSVIFGKTTQFSELI